MGADLKVAIVTFNFDPKRPGGVNSVAVRLCQIIGRIVPANIELISFSNSSYDTYSISLLRPHSYRNSLVVDDGFFQGCPVIRVGAIGSELEFLRYRKRRELEYLFASYDLVIVVTGIVQFANVIPKIKAPLLVQCATRLTWERESQYESMSRIKRFVLKSQLPFLSFQEHKVLRSQALFLVENSRMRDWIESKAIRKPEMWYPPVETAHTNSPPNLSANRKGHFISVGRLNDPRKGWERLFLAYRKAFDLNSALPDLIVIGGGEFSQSIRDLLQEQGSRYPVTILQNATDEERDLAIQSASYFLQTSYEEGLGIAALEALSFGIPLICSDTNGSQEYVIEGKSGKLIRQGIHFIDDFSHALNSSQNWDYESLHINCKELFATKFSSEASVEKLRMILKRVEVL
jgi:glycosyltransferase involved in cell wall biosynthesis